MLSEQKMKNSNLSVVSILLSFSNAKSPLPECGVCLPAKAEDEPFPAFGLGRSNPGLSIVHLMRNIFPRWVNTVPIKLIIALGHDRGSRCCRHHLLRNP